MYSVMNIGRLARSVSGFGNLRVKAWLAAHRSLTQPSHVLLRLSTPKHPPDTLSNLTTFLARISSRGIKFISCFLLPHHPEMSKIACSERITRFACCWSECRMTRGRTVAQRRHGFRSSVIHQQPEDRMDPRLASLHTPNWRRPGGGDRDRTCDPLLAKQELYQLSYAPACTMVGLCGLEPQTLRLSGVRSNHLSYRPVA